MAADKGENGPPGEGEPEMIRTTTALLSLSLLLAGCGADGAPQPPEGYQPRPDRPFMLDPVVKAPEAEQKQVRQQQR